MHRFSLFFPIFAEIIYMMKRILFFFLVLLPFLAWAQVPSIDPIGTYYSVDELGEETTGDVNGR